MDASVPTRCRPVQTTRPQAIEGVATSSLLARPVQPPPSRVIGRVENRFTVTLGEKGFGTRDGFHAPEGQPR